jgi:hypothetical protein
LLAIVLIAATAAGVQAADSLGVNFDSYAAGDLPGNNTPTDNRTAGDDTTWWVPSNAATSAEVRAGVGLGGTQGLVIGNRGNGNDGVIDNVKSPRLAESAGETGTSSGAGGTIASGKIFRSEYSFRTASDTAVDGFSFKSETYGPDRTTYFGAFYQTAFGDTSLNALAYEIRDDNGVDDDLDGFIYDFIAHPIASNLAWGEWYRVVTEITFVDGADNDVVDHFLYDSANTLVGSATGLRTWEEGARQFGYNGGQVFGVDAVQFQARGASLNGAGVPHDVAFVDNLSYSVVPEPATLGLAGVAVLGAFIARRRRAAA